MTFLNPSYLWTLLVLAIPLAIHLWSKRAGKTVKVGSVQFLRESDSSQSRSIKPNELLLLLLRSLFIIILVLILTEPHIKQTEKNESLIYLVEPSLMEDETVAQLVDSLEVDHTVRLLQPDLPDIDGPIGDLHNKTTPNYWQLVREMDALKTDSIIVFCNGYVSGLKGMRPQNSKPVEWMIMNPGATKNRVLAARLKDDQVELVHATSNSEHLKFSKELLAANDERIGFDQSKDSLTIRGEGSNKQVPLENIEPLSVFLHDDRISNNATYLRKAFQAIATYLDIGIQIEVDSDLTEAELSEHHLVYLGDGASVVEDPVRQLIYRPDPYASNIIELSAKPDQFYLTRELNSENLIDTNITEHLIRILDLNENIASKIAEVDRRVVSKEEIAVEQISGEVGEIQTNKLSLSKWLWLLLVPVIIVERLVAKLRKQ